MFLSVHIAHTKKLLLIFGINSIILWKNKGKTYITNHLCSTTLHGWFLLWFSEDACFSAEAGYLSIRVHYLKIRVRYWGRGCGAKSNLSSEVTYGQE